MYYFNLPNFQIVGSSPEILVRLRSDLITLRPIAGTRPRGKNVKQDRKYELDLLSDEKETSEHLMLLDLGRNDVGKVAKKSTVSVTAKFIIEKYSHVMHLVSNVTGKLKKNISTIEALMAGFPAGTVSGAPSNQIEYVNPTTSGSAVDTNTSFANAPSGSAGLSNAHGGL